MKYRKHTILLPIKAVRRRSAFVCALSCLAFCIAILQRFKNTRGDSHMQAEPIIEVFQATSLT